MESVRRSSSGGSNHSKQLALVACACACVSAVLCAMTIQSNHFCAMIICQNYINVASVVKYSIFLDVDVCVCVSGLDQLWSLRSRVCVCVRICEWEWANEAVNERASEWVSVLPYAVSYIGRVPNKREGDVRLPLGILTIKSKQFFEHPSNNNNWFSVLCSRYYTVVAVHTQQTDNTRADARVRPITVSVHHSLRIRATETFR